MSTGAIKFKGNPAYKEVFKSTVHKCAFYMPQDLNNGYHISRFMHAGAQNLYSASGITKETLVALAEQMIEICNDEKSTKTIRTSIGTLCNNIIYRTKYPVDEDCGIRMGALYVFMEGENPNEVKPFWLKKKIDMAKGADGVEADPDLYAFFLTMGMELTPGWRGQLPDLQKMEDYFNKRAEAIRAMQIKRRSS